MHPVQFGTDVTFKKTIVKRKFSNRILKFLKNLKAGVKIYSNISNNIPFSFLAPHIHRRLSISNVQETHQLSSISLSSLTFFFPEHLSCSQKMHFWQFIPKTVSSPLEKSEMSSVLVFSMIVSWEDRCHALIPKSTGAWEFKMLVSVVTDSVKYVQSYVYI